MQTRQDSYSAGDVSEQSEHLRCQYCHAPIQSSGDLQVIMRWGCVPTPLCGGCYQRRKAEWYSLARIHESLWPVNDWQYTLNLLVAIIALPLVTLIGGPMLRAAVGERPPFDSPFLWPVWSIVLYAVLCLSQVGARLYSYVRFERRVNQA